MRMLTGKSMQQNWLEKLRKVKGFTSDEEVHGIDHSFPRQQQQQEEPNGEDHLDRLRQRTSENVSASTRMAEILAEIFSDVSRTRNSNCKARRKQASPKMCIIPATVEDRCSNENIRVEVVDDGGVFGPVNVDRDPESERKGRKSEDCDLVGFSRTEVSIIDSSCPFWKFDKYLFRKRNVWKARDCRKGRLGCNASIGIEKKRKNGALGLGVNKKSSKSFGMRK